MWKEFGTTYIQKYSSRLEVGPARSSGRWRNKRFEVHLEFESGDRSKQLELLIREVRLQILT